MNRKERRAMQGSRREQREWEEFVREYAQDHGLSKEHARFKLDAITEAGVGERFRLGRVLTDREIDAIAEGGDRPQGK